MFLWVCEELYPHIPLYGNCSCRIIFCLWGPAVASIHRVCLLSAFFKLFLGELSLTCRKWMVLLLGIILSHYSSKRAWSCVFCFLFGCLWGAFYYWPEVCRLWWCLYVGHTQTPRAASCPRERGGAERGKETSFRGSMWRCLLIYYPIQNLAHVIARSCLKYSFGD